MHFSRGKPLCAAEKPEQKFSGGTGTAADPYKIANTDDLLELQKDVNEDGLTYAESYFVQTANIDMSTVTSGWMGLGHYTVKTKGFLGSYDGQGYTISNFILDTNTIATSDKNNYRGAFINYASTEISVPAGVTPLLTVKNLIIENVSWTEGAQSGEHGCAAFVGMARGITLENCLAKGVNNGNTHRCGGIVVQAQGSTYIKNCTNEMAVYTSANKPTGGIVGFSQGPAGLVFDGCVNKGSVSCGTATSTDIAGIIGSSGSNDGQGPVTFRNCTNLGEIGCQGGQLIGGCGADYNQFAEGDHTILNNKLAISGTDTRSALDSMWFAPKCDAETVTLLSTNDLAAGSTYLVTAKFGTAIPVQVFTLAAENDTISFDLSLVNDACNFTVGAAAGLKAEKGDVTDHVVTFTAVPDAIFPPSPKEEDIPTILSKATDTKLAANITSADDYAAFQTWATTIGQADVATSAYAWYSFALDQSALLTAEPEIDVDEVEVTEDGAFVLTVSVEDLTLGANALVKAFGAQGTDELGNVDKPFASANVTVDPATAKIENGKAVLTVTPAEKYATPAAFFFKAELK